MADLAVPPDTDPAGRPDGSALLALAERVARQAGELLRTGAADPRVDVGTKTSDTDMVSEMDRASETLIVEGILAERPDDGILGEEHGTHAGTSTVRWVIDPLDGTTNYLYGQPIWAVSVAAEVDGRVEAGVVAAPGLGEVFGAARGKGAWLNGAPIAVSGAADLATALVGTGFGYQAERRARQAAALPTLLPAVRDIRRNGVASLDLCWVACGRLDAYYEFGGQPWDVAAGLLVATEAGAFAASIDGGPARPDSVLVATPGVSASVLELLGRAGAAL